MEYKSFIAALQEVTEDRVVKSIFAVMGHIDDGNDRILPRAFLKTLKERGGRVRVLWQHDATSPPIGVPLVLKEVGVSDLPGAIVAAYPDVVGALYGEVQYLDTPRGNEVLAGIKSGAITENSIGYDPIRVDFETDPERGQIRNLREVRLWDVSPVNWGMQELAVNIKTAIPYKKTPLADIDAEWDASAEVAAASVDDLKVMCAWYDPEQADIKSGYKLPHHRARDHACVWRGVAASMAALMGARGGVDIPEGDRRAVYNHLAGHYRDFDKEPPEFKLVSMAMSVRDLLVPGAIKEGRVLSSANLERLKRALAVLQEILLAAEPPSDEEEKQKALTRARKIMAWLAIAEREASLYER